MEEEKLLRLYDTLSKLAPRGKVGGLGFNSFHKQAKQVDPSLPNNALYNHFVRAGAYHKRKFEELDSEDLPQKDNFEIKNNKKDKKDKKKSKKLKKDKKNKKFLDEMIKVDKKTNHDLSPDTDNFHFMQDDWNDTITNTDIKLTKKSEQFRNVDDNYNLKLDDDIAEENDCNIFGDKLPKQKRNKSKQNNIVSVVEINNVDIENGAIKKKLKKSKKYMKESSVLEDVEKDSRLMECQVNEIVKSKKSSKSSNNDIENICEEEGKNSKAIDKSSEVTADSLSDIIERKVKAKEKKKKSKNSSN